MTTHLGSGDFSLALSNPLKLANADSRRALRFAEARFLYHRMASHMAAPAPITAATMMPAMMVGFILESSSVASRTARRVEIWGAIRLVDYICKTQE